MSSNAPITGASTSVTAFIGSARTGPVDTPRKVVSYADFEREFGGGPMLGDAVRLFFGDGGESAWIVRTDTPETALDRLDEIDEANLLCLPGLSTPALLKHAESACRERRALLIADAPHGLSPTLMQEWAENSPLAGSDFAALYYPWLKIADPVQPKKTHVVPPSGAVAGVIARTDIRHGVWKAPAGREAVIAGVVGLETAVSDVENTALSGSGVNAVRRMSSVGIAVWGARTLAGAEGVQSDYKYVPVRRLALFIEDSLDSGLQWVVFEPNGEDLWRAVQSTVSDFLFNLWRSGAFLGQTAKEAFFVRCDRTTMTDEDIQNGRLVIEIGFAPIHPAEFVILQIAKMLGTRSIREVK
jgi:uncharacterized protein